MNASAVRSRLIHAAALVAAAAGLVPERVMAQPSYACQSVNPPTVMCIGAGPKCLHLTKECQLSYGVGQGGNRTALFFENQGTSTALWDGEDRHCYASAEFSPGDPAPEPADYGLNTFALLLPADWDEETPFPLYLDLRGALAGWVEEPFLGAGLNAWSLDVSGPLPTYKKGKYHGLKFFGEGPFNDTNIFDRLTDPGGIRGALRSYDGASWGFLVPSACSHDLYNGRPNLGEDEDDFRETELSRFGYVAILEALQLVEETYGIEYLYTGATSGGAIGSFIFARDLDDSDPFFAEPGVYRGALVDAGPFELDPMEDLYDLSETHVLFIDEQTCSGDTATVPCQHPSEPLASAFAENALTGASASDDIADPTPLITVPILHMFQTRNDTFCHDACLSEQSIHGPIREAIEARIDEPFAFSETVEGCVGSCLSLDGKLLECTGHGLLGRTAYIECALDWITEINAFWEEDEPYGRPQSCDGIPPDVSTNPPICKAGQLLPEWW